MGHPVGTNGLGAQPVDLVLFVAGKIAFEPIPLGAPILNPPHDRWFLDRVATHILAWESVALTATVGLPRESRISMAERDENCTGIVDLLPTGVSRSRPRS